MHPRRQVMDLLIIFRMIGSEEHFRTTMGQVRAACLLDALSLSSDKARSIAAREGFAESRTEPTVAFDLAVTNLAALEAFDGVRTTVVNGQHFWIVEETYALRVKKLRSGFLSTNHHSAQQELISRQQPLDGLDVQELVYLTAGTVYSDRTGLPEQRAVVKYRVGPMRRQRVEWSVDLDELAGGGMEPATPILPMPGTPAAPAAVVAKRAGGDRKPGVDAQEA